ncbi:hypothetical protein [Kitasatospora phosalacinea]|uniref:Uncharacterized protein n=1 Tax=Kitasatospora phosalacinea TaxID=2065 RepID=A0ABW6GVW1_9ACTN
MERTPGGSDGYEDADTGADADRVAARLLAEVAAAKARLVEAARAIREIDRSLAAGPERPEDGRGPGPGPGSGAG